MYKSLAIFIIATICQGRGVFFKSFRSFNGFKSLKSLKSLKGLKGLNV